MVGSRKTDHIRQCQHLPQYPVVVMTKIHSRGSLFHYHPVNTSTDLLHSESWPYKPAGDCTRGGGGKEPRRGFFTALVLQCYCGDSGTVCIFFKCVYFQFLVFICKYVYKLFVYENMVLYFHCCVYLKKCFRMFWIYDGIVPGHL